MLNDGEAVFVPFNFLALMIIVNSHKLHIKQTPETAAVLQHVVRDNLDKDQNKEVRLQLAGEFARRGT